VSESLIVTVSGKTLEEVKVKLMWVAKEFGLMLADAQMNLPLETKPKKTKEKEIEKPVEPKVEKPVEPKVEKPVEPKIEIKVETKVVGTREAAAEALKKLNSAKSVSAAREMLLKFGASRFSELKPENYGSFIEECEKAAA
jgi:outer membrane biosynthesis protein TonB